MTKLKEFIFRISYFRAYGFILAGLSGFLGCLNEITNTVNEFPYVEGRVEHIFSMYPLKMRIENSRTSYKIYGKNLSHIFKNMKINVKNAVIWYNKKNRIVQLIIDKNMIHGISGNKTYQIRHSSDTRYPEENFPRPVSKDKNLFVGAGGSVGYKTQTEEWRKKATPFLYLEFLKL